MLWPEREVIYALVRNERDLISSETCVFLRNCYDHTIQVMDLLDVSEGRQANLLILEISEIRTILGKPIPHPFIERPIGTIRQGEALSLPAGRFFTWMHQIQR